MRSAAAAMLRIRASVISELADRARRGLPNEVAGLLGADPGGCVVAAVELPGGGPDAVRIGRADAEAAARELAAGGLTRVGTYHSHTTSPPRPTEADRLAMAAGEAMLIVAAHSGEVRAYELAENRLNVRERTVRIE